LTSMTNNLKRPTRTQPRLGIDFGGVIIPMVGRRRHEDDMEFSEQFLSTEPQRDAIETVRELVQVFRGNVWIVSKAGHRTEQLTRRWLEKRQFFVLTGMQDDHLRFCRERPGKEAICRELRITHFIDDRIHVMQLLKNTVDHLYLFGEKAANRSAAKWVVLVQNWDEAFKAIVRDLQSCVL